MTSPIFSAVMTLYDDDAISIDETGITIKTYYLPRRPRQFRFDEICRAELIPIGFFTGRHQLVGIGPFRPRLFFAWDRNRSSKSHTLVLDRQKMLHAAITPSDPEQALGIIRGRIEPFRS